MGEDDFVPVWKECCDNLKECLGSVVLPIGSLSAGLCRHRALLFKVCFKYPIKTSVLLLIFFEFTSVRESFAVSD